MNKYGWMPDVPDHRDRLFGVPAAIHLPQVVDLRAKMPDVYDQGPLGSCTANAIAAAVQYERRRQGFADDFVPSRLFVYYNERVIEGTVSSDSGAMIRDGIKSVGRQGDCRESMWPYDVSKFSVKPDDLCYSQALKYKALDYWAVPRVMTQMRGCLNAGFPFVFGFSVYESFETDAVAKDGIVPYPDKDENLLGGHAVLAVGYDDTKPMLKRFPPGCFICRNSWGPNWGDKGYFYLPYQYLTNADLSDDFWTIKVEAA